MESNASSHWAQPTTVESEASTTSKQLAELLPLLENYAPVIPDAVTGYWMTRAGLDPLSCDPRLGRLIALAAQKLITDMTLDALHYARVRTQSTQTGTVNKKKKTVLTMEDVASALDEYGVHIVKPDYYQ